jgi:hypothetical protein
LAARLGNRKFTRKSKLPSGVIKRGWLENLLNTSNTEEIEEYQEEKVLSINKHKLSKNITKHCIRIKNGAPTALHSL